MESRGVYETHSQLHELRENNKFTSFGSPGSAFSPPSNYPSATQLCCLKEDGSRCKRIAGNASYSKRIQKTVQQKKLHLSIDGSARHVYICDHHKNMIQNVRSCVKRKRNDSAEDENGNNSNEGYAFSPSDRDHDHDLDTNLTITSLNNYNSNIGTNNNSNGFFSFSGSSVIPPIDGISNSGGNHSIQRTFRESILPSIPNQDYPQVDLSILQMNTLRRYKRHYHVQTRPGINKSQLAETLLNHFKGIPIDEKEAITYFIYMVKCNRNKMDQMKGLTTSNSDFPYSGSLSPHNSN